MGRSVLHIRKDYLKFSSAHMTVFPDGRKENLHGHNYSVEAHIGIREVTLKEMIPYSVFKKAMEKVCEAWDEKILLAEDCPYMKRGKSKAGEVDMTLCKKHYVLPADEVVWLPVDNVTSESLARVFFEHLLVNISEKILKRFVSDVEIRIEESPGQGSSYFWNA